MQVYISFLKGINVGGNNIIKKEVLKELYENLGFKKVTTYIQSGNIIFMAEGKNIDQLEEMIEGQIQNKLNLQIKGIVINKEILEKTIQQNPFMDKDLKFVYVTFFEKNSGIFDLKHLEGKQKPSEKVMQTGDVMYLYFPEGFGQTKLTNDFFGSKSKKVTTTRNWNTLLEVQKIAEQMY
ncbi:MAG: DUF1697 domain-containing protein [Saprospiraceae bacterium]|nr:DUF1697 domain-containing protein [Saprospiraceae bacterium]MBK7523188.1 DUF1697 domain-containing protein [Saprospiraceae bacterium]MBK8371817.1 DUF1697 domain-containing protein [Saprospiraceae bacterium]MBK8547082.1 DUF1697 domain-containing protein [Saprospiraceae bacterium]MBK8853326.1 DUF1697 domain-containing protein [Saprospiraceae bacterium]